MKIGFVSHWYDPEVGSASLSGTISRALTRRGDDVRVLTGIPNYPTGDVYPGYRIRPYQRETIRGIDVRRSAVYPNHDRSAVKRMANHLSFALASTPVSLVTLGDRDVNLVFCSPATAAVPAMVVRGVRRVPYVLHIQDLWPDSVLASGFLGNAAAESIARRGIDAYLAAAYRGAHSIAVTSPGMADALTRRGVPAGKLHLVPNWADEQAFRPVLPDAELRRTFGLTAPKVVMYAGNVGEVQGLDVLIRAAELLRNDERVQFAIVGDGVDKPRLRAMTSDLGLSNVVFVPAQPFSAMARVLALGDIQVVSLVDQPLFRMTLPSKLQATLAAGRPVVAALAGDGARVVEQSGAGMVVAPGDSAGLANVVTNMLGDDIALDRMAAAGRQHYLAHFSEAASAGALLDLLANAARS